MAQRSTLLGGGMALATVSSAAFALSGPFAKSLIDIGWSPGAAVLVRIAGAALVLVIPLVLILRARGTSGLRSHRGLLLGYGVFAVAGAQIGFFTAVQTLPVGVALLLEYLAPIMVVLWLWLRHRTPPTALTGVGAAVAMAGLVLVLDLSGDAGVDPVGVAWALWAAVCLTTYFLLSAHSHDDLPALVVVGSGMAIGTLVVVAVGVVGLMPLNFVAGQTQLGDRPVPWWVPAVGLVLITSVFSYLTGLLAVQRLGSRLASFVALVEVVFAVLAAWLLLAQIPTARQCVGGALILMGVVLVRLGEPSASPDEDARDTRGEAVCPHGDAPGERLGARPAPRG